MSSFNTGTGEDTAVKTDSQVFYYKKDLFFDSPGIEELENQYLHKFRNDIY